MFTDILEDEITKIDLRSFIRHLRTLREQVGRYPSIKFVATKLGNEALYLENMNRAVEQVKLTLRHLKERVKHLETQHKIQQILSEGGHPHTHWSGQQVRFISERFKYFTTNFSELPVSSGRRAQS
jgi:hypothetical protein